MKASTGQRVIRYHQETKHHYHRYARSAGHMDWSNQPHAFRFYEGAETEELPFPEAEPDAGYLQLYKRRQNPFRPFSLEGIGTFLSLSMGLSAWKTVPGNRWALRINPSSGNLHPTEAYLVWTGGQTMPAGVYHYNPLMHVLERRAVLSPGLWEKVQSHLGVDGFLVGLTSICWREAWKYGERAYRYCNHDVGHALAALSFAGNLMGWKVIYLNALSDDQVASVLGLDRASFVPMEEEDPGPLCFVCDRRAGDTPRGLSPEVLRIFSRLSFQGVPNRLSANPVDWSIIREIRTLTRKPSTPEQRYDMGEGSFSGEGDSGLKAAEIIRKRRSALELSGGGSLCRERFLAVLDRTVPRKAHAPFDAQIMAPCIHLLIFVHRVKGLEPGLYFFFRKDEEIEKIRPLFREEFLWERIQGDHPLFLLGRGDFRRVATMVSCHQDIAGSGAFSLGMIARFREILEEEPFRYRHLFWEAGMIGQVLYLEAEACGIRGTGIGCYFDDPVHEILGLKDDTYQSLYHFTAGEPVEDRRLITLPAYEHLRGRRSEVGGRRSEVRETRMPKMPKIEKCLKCLK